MSTINVGLVSTYNQPCGLATYAKYLVRELSSINLTILAEQSTTASASADLEDKRVLRLWSRASADYSQLEKAIIEKQIEILHLNCHQRFFHFPQFSSMLSRLQQKGIKVLCTLHNPYSLYEEITELGLSSDLITVHTPENRLEVIANGIPNERVRVVEHGVTSPSLQSKQSARTSLNISPTDPIAVCFGFVQAHKGIDEVLQAIASLRSTMPNLQLYVVGGAHSEDPSSLEYLQLLKKRTFELRLNDQIHFIEGFIPEHVVDQYLKAADVIVMNYRSQYFEASGALCKALSSGNPVITSTAPPFAHLGDAVFHITSGFPLDLAIMTIMQSPELSSTLVNSAETWCRTYSWSNMAHKFTKIYTDLLSSNSVQISPHTVPRKQIKVLMKNRPNVFTNSGGDTIVMERTAQGLRELGCLVDIDIADQKSCKDYDLVHLFNFATPDITEHYARKAVHDGVPFVVTTMYEDVPLFFNQMAVAAEALVQYINLGQTADSWKELSNHIQSTRPCNRLANDYTAAHAGRLIATGESEKTTLLRDYPSAKVSTYRCGCDITEFEDNGELFKSQYGLSDFILCVGRLETRKNQLMLLKALEESNLTVVLATGGFTYQPDYEKACRAFKRAGKTIFLDKLERRHLVSAYRAARIHALPSWYELPGIVSMEAARAGRNIVVCDNGTTRNYFGENAFYCKPEDPQSIYQAVLGAYYCPPLKGLTETVANCTWLAAAKRYLEIYEDILQTSMTHSTPESRSSRITSEDKSTLVRGMSNIKTTTQDLINTLGNINPNSLKGQKPNIDHLSKDLCDRGDEYAAREQILDAKNCFEQALARSPEWSRPPRSLGVIALSTENFEEAESWFNRAISCDPTDGKAWAGKGNALWELGREEEALQLYKHAIEKQPAELAFLPLILKAAYGLERIADITSILRDYVSRYPDNCAVRYCLAGALFKQNRLTEAKAEAQFILSISPNHADAIQLVEIIANNPPANPLHTPQMSDGTTIAHKIDIWDDVLDQLENSKHDREYEQVVNRSRELLSQQGLRPDQRAHASVLMGESFACLDQFSKARECFSSASSDPDFASRAHAGLGAIALADSHLNEANQHFNRALELNARNDIALAGLAHCRGAQGAHGDAWELYLSALSCNPENLRAILGVIEYGYKRNDLSTIEDSLRNYLTYHPADLGMIYSLAGCLFAQGRLDESKKELRNLLSLSPNHELGLELMQIIENKMELNVQL